MLQYTVPKYKSVTTTCALDCIFFFVTKLVLEWVQHDRQLWQSVKNETQMNRHVRQGSSTKFQYLSNSIAYEDPLIMKLHCERITWTWSKAYQRVFKTEWCTYESCRFKMWTLGAAGATVCEKQFVKPWCHAGTIVTLCANHIHSLSQDANQRQPLLHHSDSRWKPRCHIIELQCHTTATVCKKQCHTAALYWQWADQCYGAP